MLIILGGLPGVGKTTIGKKLAETLRAVYLRIDTIEQAIKKASNDNNPNKVQIVAEGYMTAYAIAKDNLEIGLTVITDSVNPIEMTRHAYREVAQEANKPYFEVEIVCSDKDEHQRRIETREETIQGLQLPTWQDVLRRDYEKWETKHLRIDTAIYTVDEVVDIIRTEIIKRQI